MASVFNASNYQGAVTSLANRLESKDVEFTVKYKKASFTTDDGLDAADKINLAIIPAGCRVIEFDDGSNALGDLIMSALPGPTVSPLRLVVGKSVIERQVYP